MSASQRKSSQPRQAGIDLFLKVRELEIVPDEVVFSRAFVHHAVAGQEEHDQVVRPCVLEMRFELLDHFAPLLRRDVRVGQQDGLVEHVQPLGGRLQFGGYRLGVGDGIGKRLNLRVAVVVDSQHDQAQSRRRGRPGNGSLDHHVAEGGRRRIRADDHLDQVPFVLGQGDLPLESDLLSAVHVASR